MMFSFLSFCFVKINLTDNAAQREARLAETESELARAQATCTRLTQVILYKLSYICCVSLYYYWLSKLI